MQRREQIVRLRERVFRAAERHAGHAEPRLLALKAERDSPRLRVHKAGVILESSVHDRDLRLWRVVLILHARRRDARVFGGLFEHRAIHLDAAEHGAELLDRDAARPQHARHVPDDCDNRRFQPDRAVAAVNDRLHAAHQVVADVLEGRGARQAREIRGRRRERHARRTDDRARRRVRRHAHRDGTESAGRLLRHKRRFFHDDRQRPRPERRGQLFRRLGNLRDERRQLLQRADMYDQRVVGRPPFDRVDARGNRGVQRVAREAVDRFGRDRRKAAPSEDLPRRLYIICLSGMQNACIHVHPFSMLSLSFSARSAAISASMISSRSPFRMSASR